MALTVNGFNEVAFAKKSDEGSNASASESEVRAQLVSTDGRGALTKCVEGCEEVPGMELGGWSSTTIRVQSLG